MNARILAAIVKKDLLEVKQNTSVMMSIIIVPLIFIVVLPLILMIAVSSVQDPAEIQRQLSELGPMLQNMPASMNQYLAPWNEYQKWFVLFLGMFMAPMFLIMPLMTASAIAAESFAGERERKTMEALLYT